MHIWLCVCMYIYIYMFIVYRYSVLSCVTSCRIVSCHSARDVRGLVPPGGHRSVHRFKPVCMHACIHTGMYAYVWGSNPRLGGLRVSPLQVSGGMSTLQSRASGLQSTTQGIPSGPKGLLRVKQNNI